MDLRRTHAARIDPSRMDGAHGRAALALAALIVGAAAIATALPAHAAQAKAPAVEEDVTMFEMVPGTVYLNGGVGHEQAERMRRDARNWPLRLTFSDKSNHEFVAGVRLKIFDPSGRAVLRLQDAGPLTFVQLPQGDYRITARYRGEALERTVHIGTGGLDANFHWLI